jgi:thiamine transport system permease protein
LNRAQWLSEQRTHSLRVSLLLWILPLVFLLFFFFYPLGTIFFEVIKTAVTQGVRYFNWLLIWRPLRFTLWQASLSTLLTLVIGLPSAYIFARFSFPGKGTMRVLTTLPFILPTVVVAASFNALLGPNGWINLLLMRLFNLSSPPVQIINTFSAILLAHIFYNTTIVIRVVGSALAQMNPRFEQAARVLGASRWRTLWEVTFPMARSAVLAAALLVFLFDFTSFGVILLLGGPRLTTLEVEIYIQALNLLNLPVAGVLSAIQLICTLAITVFYQRLGFAESSQVSPRLRGEAEEPLHSWKQRLLVGGLVFFLVLLLVLPLGALALRSFSQTTANRGERGTYQTGLTLDYYRELFINRRGSLFYVPPIDAARNSLIYASATVIITLTLGYLASYALVRRSKLNRLFDPLLMLPLGTSAVTLGLGFIIVFNRPPFSVNAFPYLIPIAHSLVALPFVVRVLQPAIASIPDTLRQAASVLGANPLRVWREVDLPIVLRASLVAAIFSFTISLGEFGATSFLVRPEYPTLPIAIYGFLSQPGALNYGQAMAMATILLAVCGISILALERLQEPVSRIL